MHCHYDTNNRAPRWTFTDPCKPEVRPGAREESASPTWLAVPAMNSRDTTKVYVWRLDTGCGPTLYRKCHSNNTPGKRHNNTWVEPLRVTVLPAPHGKGNNSHLVISYGKRRTWHTCEVMGQSNQVHQFKLLKVISYWVNIILYRNDKEKMLFQ